MALDYAELATTAHELLVDAGREAVFTRRAAGTEVFDSSTLTVSGASTVTASVVIADFDYDNIRGGRFNAVDAGGQIETGDRQVLMSPKTAAGDDISWDPAPDDLLTLSDGNTWRVVRLEGAIRPAGTTVLFILQMRRGGTNPHG